MIKYNVFLPSKIACSAVNTQLHISTKDHCKIYIRMYVGARFGNRVSTVQKLVCKMLWHNGTHFSAFEFVVYTYVCVCMYVCIPMYFTIWLIFLSYFHVSNGTLFLTSILVISLSIDLILTLSIFLGIHFQQTIPNKLLLTPGYLPLRIFSLPEIRVDWNDVGI